MHLSGTSTCSLEGPPSGQAAAAGGRSTIGKSYGFLDVLETVGPGG